MKAKSAGDLSLRWHTEERCLSGKGTWMIFARAARIKQDDILAYGWTATYDHAIPTAAICFHYEAATRWSALFTLPSLH